MSVITDHLVIVGFVVVILLGGFLTYNYLSSSTLTGCEVTDKDRISKSEGRSQMRVYTRNCGTFEINDNIFKTGFSSGDVYGSIEAGKTYDITYYGWRIPFFSMFHKVDEVKEVK